jgi:hypothetical protein
MSSTINGSPLFIEPWEGGAAVLFSKTIFFQFAILKSFH